MQNPITIVSHDLGTLVGYAYAPLWPDEVLGLGGTASFFLPIAEQMLSEVAESVTVRAVEDSGHWMAEEQPEKLLERLREWFQETGG
ncbi:alpha/beta fold hydrolase [Streptomyces spinosus]|uniref:alpha/beta fold hydrolase n=1 Tax=Streptomyces spinosus TaxID=2872623 RepID=UPI001CED98B7|nr:alpha/beta hydrolase [Streptomyces spinosus]